MNDKLYKQKVLIEPHGKEIKGSKEYKSLNKKFGLINGRFQPPHRGHQEIINEILLEGLIPIIVLGSSQESRDKRKNPLTYAERKYLLRLVYPNTPIVFVRSEDFNDWDTWYHNMMKKVKTVLYEEFDEDFNLQDNIVIFHNNKEVDRLDFSFNGKQYYDTWYSDIFDDEGFETREVKFVKRDDIHIDSNARDIRRDLEGRKHLLDARIYFQLKEIGWE